MIYNEVEIRRIAHVAFQAAQKRDRKLCSVDKMNVLECTQLWRDVVTETAKDYPDVTLSHMLVDNAAMIGYLGLKMYKSGISETDMGKVDINPRERTDEVNVIWK